MNRLTRENLVANMVIKLQAFNDEKVTISAGTVHKEVLSVSDSIGGRPSSASLYQWSIEWTIDKAEATNTTWPENWLDLTVNDLADYIISKQAAV